MKLKNTSKNLELEKESKTLQTEKQDTYSGSRMLTESEIEQLRKETREYRKAIKPMLEKALAPLINKE